MNVTSKLNYSIFIGCLCVLLSFSACEEYSPFESVINGETAAILSDTTFVADIEEAQAKMVVMEEFSGVRCINCPEGNRKADELLTIYPDHLIVTTLHAGYLAFPYPESNHDFVTDETTFLFDFLEVQAYPAASINRVHFEDENNIAVLGLNKWEGKVSAELAVSPPVNVYITPEYNGETRNLKVIVEMRYTQAVSTNNALSIYITENNIIDAQLNEVEDADVVQTDYIHKHVVRDMMTNVLGSPIDVEKTPGRVVARVFETTLPTEWVAENCEIIAFVHNTGDSNKRILQAARTYLEEE